MLTEDLNECAISEVKEVEDERESVRVERVGSIYLMNYCLIQLSSINGNPSQLSAGASSLILTTIVEHLSVPSL